ncbi:hypothetical protein BDW72DRAFT_184598 [Aspergillus terricola var. indicus]
MKPLSCHFAGCNSSYQRKEHLHRHLAQHASNPRKTPCPFCDRSFSRYDLMRRHARQTHNSETRRLCEVRDVRASRICEACRMANSNCEGWDPCRRCVHNGLECSPSNDQLGCGRLSPGYTSTIRNYTQRYFQVFHPQWPFLHPSTYRIESEPSLLVYSVVAMGLWIDGLASSRTAALALHAKLGDYILQQQDQWDGTLLQSNQDNLTKSTCPVATYQAILLYLIFAVQKPHQLPLSRTHYDILLALVRACRRQHLFFYPRMVQRYSGITSMACIWVGVEEIKRFGIALSRVCELYRDRITGDVDQSGFLTLAELQFPVPDSDELWNAESNAVLAQRLADLKPDAALDGRREENWISNFSRQTAFS